MEYRRLGKTELNLSAIGLGSFGLGGTMWGGTNENKALNAIHASLDHGVSTIDTAPFYGLGLSEELIGEAIKSRDRNKIQLLTKFGMVWDNSNQGRGDFMFELVDNGINYCMYRFASKKSVIKEAEQSLKRLDTDYLDLFQIHWHDPATPIDETMEALQILIDQGKILHGGVCNYNVQEVKTASESILVASNQVPYSILNRPVETAIMPHAIAENLGIIVYSPLERGLLTGKYFNGARLKSDDHRNDYFSQFDLEKVKAFLDNIEPLAKDKNATVSQIVLRWTTLQPGITIVLAGARDADQAVNNARCMEISLSPGEIAWIEQELVHAGISRVRKKRQLKWGFGGIIIWE